MERVEGYYGTEAEFATKGIAPRRRPERGQVKSDERWAPFPSSEEEGLSRCASGISATTNNKT